MNRLWLILILSLTLVGCTSTDFIDYIETYISPTISAPTTQEVVGDSTGDWYEVYFTSPTIPFDKVYFGGIEEHLIQKINAAQNTIDLAVFEFDLENVAQSLIQAEERGVKVRVVYDNEYSDPDPQMAELISSGIEAVPDNRSAYMHNKFFIFDGKCIWTGSFNISLNAAYKNNENALYFCSQEVATNYTTEFSEMFADQFGPSSPSDTPYPSFTIDGIFIENYFAPEDEVMNKVIKAVENAKTYIHFMAFSFTDDALADVMIQKKNQGIALGGIFETRGANTEYSQCQTLLSAGADISLDGNPSTFHHKVIVIDDTTVILGSFNFSSNANESNDENLLIVHDSSLATAYEQEYQRMKLQSVIPLGNDCTK